MPRSRFARISAALVPVAAALGLFAPGAMASEPFGPSGPVANAAGNVQEWGGIIRPGTHSARGSAAVVRLSGGRRILTLRNFAIRPGPVVKVFLASGTRGNGAVGSHVDLGRLKGSRGNQSYRIPRGVRVSRLRTVVFWCVPFTQVLGRAQLRRS